MAGTTTTSKLATGTGAALASLQLASGTPGLSVSSARASTIRPSRSVRHGHRCKEEPEQRRRVGHRAESRKTGSRRTRASLSARRACAADRGIDAPWTRRFRVLRPREPPRCSMTLTLAGSWGRSGVARWAPIPLRLIVGFGFMQHGFAKLSRGPYAFATILHALGVPAPHFMAWVSILTELLGGLAVLVGAFVTLASIPMAMLLVVAVFTVHLPNGFSSIKLIAVTAAGPQFGPVGYEVNLLYLACLAALVLGGAGPFALDASLQTRKYEKPPTLER